MDKIKKIDYFNLTSKQMDFYYKIFSKLVKDLGEWDLKLDQNSLEFVDGFIQSAHESFIARKHDMIIDLNEYGEKEKAWYNDFLISGCGSFIAKLCLKKYGGKIVKKDFSGIKKATVTVTKKGTTFSPWIWVEKHLFNGSEDSVLTKFSSIGKLRL